MTTPPKNPNKQEEKQGVADKLKDSLDSLKKSDAVDKVYRFATSNVRDTIAYVLMLTGLLLLFFEPYYAGILIGVIFGLYFAPELTSLYTDFQSITEKLGPVRSFIFAGLLVAFFISAPFIFFGAIIAVAVKKLMVPD